ncbi:hypothetical protein I5M32_00255 [Pedobacter sp. SD-b]|uniref:Uncharacterized protein n=1 Tax=Pedobacter segetis TaxID=2793069 RepID=A0ABS1BET5_9SPHI|nr:hypothetical protein [Pedobacter segetis]MBK0381375.1 hypothetical protein [Pedobacter segetis]
METKKTEEKSLLIELREIRNKLNDDMKDMSLEQIAAFLKNKETLHKKGFWAK